MRLPNIAAGIKVINQALSALVRDKIEGIRFEEAGVPKCMLLRQKTLSRYTTAKQSISSSFRAQLLLNGDEPNLAYDDILEVLKENPDDFIATCVKAKCMYMMGDFEKCLLVWHKARKIRGNIAEVNQNQLQVLVSFDKI